MSSTQVTSAAICSTVFHGPCFVAAWTTSQNQEVQLSLIIVAQNRKLSIQQWRLFAMTEMYLLYVPWYMYDTESDCDDSRDNKHDILGDDVANRLAIGWYVH